MIVTARHASEVPPQSDLLMPLTADDDKSLLQMIEDIISRAMAAAVCDVEPGCYSARTQGVNGSRRLEARRFFESGAFSQFCRWTNADNVLLGRLALEEIDGRVEERDAAHAAGERTPQYATRGA